MRRQYPTMSLDIEALESALARSGKTQADLARALKVSRGTISRWFSGQGEPETVDRLKQLAEELSVSLAALVGEEDAAANERERLLLRAFRDLGEVQGEAAIALMVAMQQREG